MKLNLFVTGTVIVFAAVEFFPSSCAQAQAAKAAEKFPSQEEVAELLLREPMTLAAWPQWRERLLAWMGDRSQRTNAAYEAAHSLMKSQADAKGELPPELSQDSLAWYMLGSAYLRESGEGADSPARAGRAEAALRRSLKLDPKFARAHRNLALSLMQQEPPQQGAQPGPKRREAQKELDEARRLDPALPLKRFEIQAALQVNDFARAEQVGAQALQEDPQDVLVAQMTALAILSNPQRQEHVSAVKSLLDKFPDDGIFVALHAAALAADKRYPEAAKELERARRLGTDPAQIIGPELVQKIEKAAAPGWIESLAWVMAYFAGFYAVVMGLMAGAGLILAKRTRGDRALQLLQNEASELVTAGRVAQSQDESSLAKLYSVALFLGLLLFYASIPFIIVGLLGLTLGLLYLIFQMPRIPVKLILIVVVVGGGAAWMVLKSLFAGGRGSFGIPKSAQDCPRLHEAVREVARNVDTDPVDELYLAPGASIGVHQEGRGPFGIFGVKRRVLTLGLSTMHYLTVPELKSILAHEYAHFSHRDTFYSRFIHQVTLSIEGALRGMGETGGKLHYGNPFFWFLYLYYKAYTLLAAGYSRSREFLADRMASSLYGADVFTAALTKVSTDGSLFEMTIYDNIGQLLEKDQSFINMYAAFRSFRDEQLSGQERAEMYQKLLEEKGSLFASHPTFGERIKAVAPLPKALAADSTSALLLFENPEEIEKELTDFLTGFVYHMRQLQAQAAAQ